MSEDEKALRRKLRVHDRQLGDSLNGGKVQSMDRLVEEVAANGWELAALLAAKMLPQIFRLDSPAFQLYFAVNHQLPLEKLLADLTTGVFTASDSLGWVYQF